MRILLLAASLCVPALSAAAEWCSADGSTLGFRTTFEGEALPGTFGRFDVVFDFDAGRLGDASLRVVVDLRAADMGDEDMNAVLFDEAWLNVGKHERAVFTSDDLVERAPGDYVAHGMLALKGREVAVTVPFSWSANEQSAAMRGELSLRRTDFDVGTGEWSSGDSIGLDVRVSFDVRLEPCD